MIGQGGGHTKRAVRLFAVIALLGCLVACGGSGPDHLPLRSDLEVERRARRQAEEERRRAEIAAINARAEAQRLRREREEARRREIEARRRADADAARRRQEGESGQVCGRNSDDSAWCTDAEEYTARKAREREEQLRNAEPRDLTGQVRTFEPWPDHSMPQPTNLGPWSNYGDLLVEVSDHAIFGVRDDGVPWFRGTIPNTSLYANEEVRRTYDEYGYWTESFSTARWRGSLVGYAQGRRVVTGKATLGDFSFNGREYDHRAWNPGAARLVLSELQYRDTGVVWGDGDLRYEVRIGRTHAGGNPVHDSSFSYPSTDFNCTQHAGGCHADALAVGPGGPPRPGSDAGVVRGMLLGPKHGAMAGTLHRGDLVAAFGGTR